jgi:hypothetical protein
MLRIGDEWAAYQFDQAVLMVGTAIENAAQETHNVGDDQHPKYESKYRMDELLDPDFRLPAPPTKEQRERAGLGALKALARKSGGKVTFKRVANGDGAGS